MLYNPEVLQLLEHAVKRGSTTLQILLETSVTTFDGRGDEVAEMKVLVNPKLDQLLLKDKLCASYIAHRSLVIYDFHFFKGVIVRSLRSGEEQCIPVLEEVLELLMTTVDTISTSYWL